MAGNMSETELRCVEDAIERNYNKQWANALAEEIKSLSNKYMFDVVMKPEGRQVEASRWAFLLMKNSQGQIVRHRARLVATGYFRTYAIEYAETYAPVAKFATLRFLLAHATPHELEMKQVDVRTALLHGE